MLGKKFDRTNDQWLRFYILSLWQKNLSRGTYLHVIRDARGHEVPKCSRFASRTGCDPVLNAWLRLESSSQTNIPALIKSDCCSWHTRLPCSWKSSRNPPLVLAPPQSLTKAVLMHQREGEDHHRCVYRSVSLACGENELSNCNSGCISQHAIRIFFDLCNLFGSRVND